MKLRVRATKIGKVRFTSHRDAARLWERALRKAQLPVAATEGFTGTDEASLLERIGRRVVVVRGEPFNVKVTEPEDLAVVEALLEREA